MDISQLKTLIHVAELGSLSKASERLNVVQPALSRQIRLLEKELGAYLFDRHGRGMVITDAGREVLEHAERIMGELDAIRTVAAPQTEALTGLVSVGTPPTVAEIVTVPLATRVREAHPGLSLRFTSAYSGYLLDWLQKGDLDLMLSYMSPEPLRTLRVTPVMVEDLLLVGAGSDRLSLDSPHPFACLADFDMILPSPRHGLRTIVEACARRAGIEIRTAVEADSFRALVDLVAAGFGATVLPLAPIYAAVQAGTLSVAPLVDPQPMRELVIAYPSDRAISPAARFLGEAVTNVAGDLVGRGIWAGRMLPRQKR
jgi:DNA-binding transcriptional LysR family regulator